LGVATRHRTRECWCSRHRLHPYHSHFHHPGCRKAA